MCSKSQEKALLFFESLTKLTQSHLPKEVREKIWHTLASLPLEKKRKEIQALLLSALQKEEPDIQISAARALENFGKNCLETKHSC